jgi:aryl-alcohol dehydrogenase-like predicted oxidoreductase
MNLPDLVTGNGDSLCPLGLGSYPNQDAACVDLAFRRGINLFFFYDLTRPGFVQAVGRLSRSNRQSIFIASGTSERRRHNLESDLRQTLNVLGADYLDAYLAEYIAPDDSDQDIFGADGVLAGLRDLKQRGLVRHIGASVHSRDLALRLIADGRIEMLMHRYNMAHRKSAERVLPAAEQAGIPVWAFTATRWGSLMQGHSRWTDAPPSAAECYRYCLAQPAVKTILTAPETVEELEDDLSALKAGPMSREEIEKWSAFGDLVYGSGNTQFETAWP